MYDSLIGNKNAETWPEERFMLLLSNMLEQSKDCYFIGNLLKDNDLSLQMWGYLQDKFKDLKTVSETIKKIEQATETNLVNAMLRGEVKETGSIFLLKCKYGYQDKQTIEVEHKGSVAVNFNFPEQDEHGE